MKLFIARLRATQELRDFRAERLAHLAEDDRRRNGHPSRPREVLEAEDLKRNIMRRLAFLRPVCREWPCRETVDLRVAIDIDTQYELARFASKVGVKDWQHLVLLYYALRMEDKKKGGLP